MTHPSDIPKLQIKMKWRYETMLQEVAETKLPKEVMRKAWVDMMIQKILSARDILESEDKSDLPIVDEKALDLYDVDNSFPEPRLVTKSSTLHEDAKRVIPLEDSFEIALRAHLCTEHGGCSDMKRWLNMYKYEISKICASALISVCQKCFLGTDDPDIVTLEKEFKNTPHNSEDIEPIGSHKSVKDKHTKMPDNSSVVVNVKSNAFSSPIMKTLTEKYTRIAYVTIVEMRMQPDRSFNYILIYQDVKTLFVQIRPITDYYLRAEITMELVKLFTDFTPPNFIVVNTKWLPLFANIVNNLNNVFEPNIAIGSCDPDDTNISSYVAVNISSWISKSKCNYWSLGVHLIQWKMNNTKNNDATTPFERFFNLKPDCSRDNTVMPHVDVETREEQYDNDEIQNIDNTVMPHADVETREEQYDNDETQNNDVTVMPHADVETRDEQFNNDETQNIDNTVMPHADVETREEQYDSDETQNIDNTVMPHADVETREEQYDSDETLNIDNTVMPHADVETKEEQYDSDETQNIDNTVMLHADVETKEEQYDSDETQNIDNTVMPHADVETRYEQYNNDITQNIAVIVETNTVNVEDSQTVAAPKVNVTNDSSTHISPEPSDTVTENIPVSLDNVKMEEMEVQEPIEFDKVKEKHVCCTCNDVMRAQVYKCCQCRRTMHLYCGARRMGVNNVMENICYTCVK